MRRQTRNLFVYYKMSYCVNAPNISRICTCLIQTNCFFLNSEVTAHAVKGSYFGYGKGPVWLADVDCQGNENDLTNCQINWSGGINCEHRRDAGVVCTCKFTKNNLL